MLPRRLNMGRTCALALSCLAPFIIFAGGLLDAQQDPGPRGGVAAAGGPYPTLNATERELFLKARSRFAEIHSVTGTIDGEGGTGLGPTFNANSCAQCHQQPAFGGSSPGLSSPQSSVPNPQVALATLDGANNTVPSFITTEGPVRHIRLVRNSDGTPDGGVHGLYTIAGRSDATGCKLAQPNFAAQLADHNVVFRIPGQLFGLGLVENTPDTVLQENLSADEAAKLALGISGHLNTSTDDGTVTRFGWKAQIKSLLMFAGEASSVEMGVSNELFPNERSAVPGCVFNANPEDYTQPYGTAANYQISSGITDFAIFARLSAPPGRGTSSPSVQNGSNLFIKIGCAECHTPSLTNGRSQYTGMSTVTYHPYSDFALHHMGASLADGIAQGTAGPDEFRTAPLWGLGQRLYFLHDGRVSDLLEAIKAHFSNGSEADAVIKNFNALSPSQIQDILNFLRSL